MTVHTQPIIIKEMLGYIPEEGKCFIGLEFNSRRRQPVFERVLCICEAQVQSQHPQQ